MTETMQRADTVEALRSRAHWYRLLAGAFAEEPQSGFLRELRGEHCLADLAELGVDFDADFLGRDEEVLAEELAAEYTMLFIAPGGFPPVESVRLQGGYRQSAVNETRDAYAAEGFAVQSGRFATFEDHLSVEMQFIAALLERQAEALSAGDVKDARRLDKVVKRFWVKHLGRWSRGFAQTVEGATEYSFYREMARLLEAFTLAELEVLGLDVADEDGARLRAPKPDAVTRPMQCGGAAT
ncbi:TorD/DmsD family molecular chaperone [Thiohalomonas denitrificans]|uniref:TorD/DmsD family molecular chaperone n=1 Tax=Thiohalomonas denitrificans TaxID=415747 RepID=UPI0026F06047|nr:molecular chaperone TorD family protein [Thiohalomonas denitrificans]